MSSPFVTCRRRNSRDAGDEGVHRDVPAPGEGAGLHGEAVGEVDVECHARVIMAAKSRGSKTPAPSY